MVVVVVVVVVVGTLPLSSPPARTASPSGVAIKWRRSHPPPSTMFGPGASTHALVYMHVSLPSNCVKQSTVEGRGRPVRGSREGSNLSSPVADPASLGVIVEEVVGEEGVEMS